MTRCTGSTYLLLYLFYFAACQPPRSIRKQLHEIGVGEEAWELSVTHFAACQADGTGSRQLPEELFENVRVGKEMLGLLCCCACFAGKRSTQLFERGLNMRAGGGFGKISCFCCMPYTLLI